MAQFTKFTNLPIYSDPQRTAITNTLITDIPEYDLRDDKGDLISMRYSDMYLLQSNRDLEDGSTLSILEQEDHEWSIQHFDPRTKVRTTERSNGRWDKYILVEKDGHESFQILEEHYVDDDVIQYREYIETDTEYNKELHFNPEGKKYTFNVPGFMAFNIRKLAKDTPEIELHEDYETTSMVAEKDAMLIGIDELVAQLLKVKEQIVKHG